MEIELTTQLAALAHPRRLDLFRLLMRRYPDAVSAGDLSLALGLKPSTTSVYLATLRQAGVIEQSRVGTSLLYKAGLPGLRGMFDGLLTGCCQNRADLCTLPAVPPLATQRPLNALFVCSGNSARSIMAEAILRTQASDRFNAFSAGTRPAAAPKTAALDLLAAKGHEITGLNSKGFDGYLTQDAPVMDFVITVCDQAANTPNPTWPGSPVSGHWSVPDPSTVSGPNRFEQTYDILSHRIRAFADIPFGQLDHAKVQHRIDAISHSLPSDEPAPRKRLENNYF